jgi:hypothetical protein
MASWLVNESEHGRKWLLLIREVAERSKLFAEMSDADRAKSLHLAMEDALDLGRALGFGLDECRREFHKLFDAEVSDA